MKKIFSLLVVMGMITTLSAQQMIQRIPEQQFKIASSIIESMPIVKQAGAMQATSYVGGFPQLAPQKASEDAKVDTLSLPAAYVANNEMYGAMGAFGYYFPPKLMVPYRDSVTYYSYFMPGKWTLDTISVENAASFTQQTHYVDNIPTLSIPSLLVNDSTYAQFSDYYYGKALADVYNMEYPEEDPINSYILSGYYYPMLVTNCATVSSIDTSSIYDYTTLYAGDSPYAYGTNLKDDDGTLVDTIGVLFPMNADDITYVDTAFLRIYVIDTVKTAVVDGKINYVFDTLKNAIPAGKEIYLKLYPVELVENPDGSKTNMINTDSVIAMATATAADVIKGYGYYDWQGEIAFTFKKKNVLGVSQPAPAIIKGRFYAELTGFNEAGCNFGIWCDYDNFTTNGRTMFVKNGKYTALWSSPKNVDLALNAFFPHIEPDTTLFEMGVPGQGGDALFYDEAGNPDEDYGEWLMFYGNVINLDLMTYEGDEWLEVTFNDYYIKQDYLVQLAKITAEANPVAEEREGHVTLSFAGVEFTYTIKQEAGTVGVENVKYLNDGKMYNVLGMEVDENYNGIIIQNGKKFIR